MKQFCSSNWKAKWKQAGVSGCRAASRSQGLGAWRHCKRLSLASTTLGCTARCWLVVSSFTMACQLG